jgi:hypothetical protein
MIVQELSIVRRARGSGISWGADLRDRESSLAKLAKLAKWLEMGRLVARFE